MAAATVRFGLQTAVCVLVGEMSSYLTLREFLHRPVRVVDGRIGVGIGTSVGVGDRDPPVWLARNLAGLFAALHPEVVRQRVVLVGVTMWSAVDGNTENIGCGIEPATAERATQLVANAAFDGGKRG